MLISIKDIYDYYCILSDLTFLIVGVSNLTNHNISTTLLKGIEVLRCFSNGNYNLTIADISKLTGYDRASARRLCLTLVEASLLIQKDRNFQLSPRILTFAGNFLQANDLGQSVQPLLNRYAKELGDEISLAIKDGNQVLYIAHSATTDARVSFGLTVGSSLPILPTATGRMLLATLPEAERNNIIDQQELEKYTASTIVKKTDLLKELIKIGENSVAIVDGEYEPGIRAIAVPIGNHGNYFGVLGATIPMGVKDLNGRSEDIISTLQMASSNLYRLNALSNW